MKRLKTSEVKVGDIMEDFFINAVSLSAAFLALYYPIEVIRVGYGKKKIKKKYLSLNGYRVLGFTLLLLGIVANIFIIGALFSLYN